jgi:hypothetical protein
MRSLPFHLYPHIHILLCCKLCYSAEEEVTDLLIYQDRDSVEWGTSVHTLRYIHPSLSSIIHLQVQKEIPHQELSIWEELLCAPVCTFSAYIPSKQLNLFTYIPQASLKHITMDVRTSSPLIEIHSDLFKIEICTLLSRREFSHRPYTPRTSLHTYNYNHLNTNRY